MCISPPKVIVSFSCQCCLSGDATDFLCFVCLIDLLKSFCFPYIQETCTDDGPIPVPESLDMTSDAQINREEDNFNFTSMSSEYQCFQCLSPAKGEGDLNLVSSTVEVL